MLCTPMWMQLFAVCQLSAQTTGKGGLEEVGKGYGWGSQWEETFIIC